MEAPSLISSFHLPSPYPTSRIYVDRLQRCVAWPKRDGVTNVNVTSSAKGVWRSLSPMILGPILFSSLSCPPTRDLELPHSALYFENLWQYSKVWEGDLADDGSLKHTFFSRRSSGFASEKARRRIPGCHGSKRTLCTYWDGQMLSYLQARALLYCPIYAELVRPTEGFSRLRDMVEDGMPIQLLGYDGYDVSDRSLYECFVDETRPFGHELVLASMLSGVEPWVDYLRLHPMAKISVASVL